MFRRMIKLTLFPSTWIQGGTSDIPEELLGNSYSINLPFIERKPPVFNLRCITNSPNTHFIMIHPSLGFKRTYNTKTINLRWCWIHFFSSLQGSSEQFYHFGHSGLMSPPSSKNLGLFVQNLIDWLWIQQLP